jgi:transcriptional regulator with XRE-family HTH domain
MKRMTMAHAPHVTILRDALGAAQHAVLPWGQFQALLQAAKNDEGTDPIAQVSRPAQVREAIGSGVHPVRAWRDYRSLSQAQLAAIVGISRAYLAQIEGGERTGTLDVTARLARALGCLIEQVMAPIEDFAGKVAALGAMPSKIRDIVDAIPRDAWTARPATGGFSLLEHICHLRDIDGDGYRERVERMLTEEQPSLADIDGDALARDRDYQSQDLEEALSRFAATRWQMAARIARLTPDERQRIGLMAATNKITIEDLVGAMLAHDSEHLDQLSELCGELASR